MTTATSGQKKPTTKRLAKKLDKISATIRDAESYLLDECCFVEVGFAVGQGYLSWGKHGKRFRILYTLKDHTDPLIERPVMCRVECLPHLERLKTEAYQKMDELLTSLGV